MNWAVCLQTCGIFHYLETATLQYSFQCVRVCVQGRRKSRSIFLVPSCVRLALQNNLMAKCLSINKMFAVV